MPESLRTRLFRLRLNTYPAYWSTGARLTYLADDFRKVRLKLPLTWRTRNVVGTLFGGSMFGAVDPVYMVMLMRNLGSEYVVWDKAATIRFLKPGRETLYAHFTLTDAELDGLRNELDTASAAERTYTIDLVNAEGVVHATLEKTIHVRRKTNRGREPVADEIPRAEQREGLTRSVQQHGLLLS